MDGSTIEAIRRGLARVPKEQVVVDPCLTPAGVMVLLYPRNGEYCVILNRRTDQVEHHKGEISFPGGRLEQNDATLLDTALRETHEEIGVRPEDVDLLGEMDDVPTSSRFLIRPYVGVIPYPYEFKPSEREVAEVLQVPISALTDQSNLRDEVRLVEGQVVHSPSYVYRGHLVFGVTARLLARLLESLDSAPLEEAPWKLG